MNRRQLAAVRTLRWALSVCAIEAGLWLGGGALWADTITLKNGNRIQGTVIRETADEVVVDLGAGTMTFQRGEIDTLVRDEAPSEFSHPAQSPHASGATEGPRRRAQKRTLGKLKPPPKETPTVSRQDLLTYAEQILPVVVALRQLPLKAQVEKQVTNKAAIRRRLEGEGQEKPADSAAAIRKVINEGRALVMLGLLPSYVNYADYLIDMYTHSVAGLYDPKTKVLYISDWIPLDQQASTIAHELVHALQDQHFDLTKYLDGAGEDEEARMARRAVVEGEAFAVEMTLKLQGTGQSFTQVADLARVYQLIRQQLDLLNPDSKKLPEFLDQLGAFPYIYGGAFVQAALRLHPWSWMAQLYQDPPVSTEQIMHPRKYLTERDDPTRVRLPDLAGVIGPEWALMWEGVLREFTIMELIRRFADPPVASQAAAGWDGDLVQVYEHATTRQLLLVLSSVWDTPSDASEFLVAYHWVVAGKYLDEQEVEGVPGLWRTEAGDVLVERKNVKVLVVEGVPTGLRDEFVKVLWKSIALSGIGSPALTGPWARLEVPQAELGPEAVRVISRQCPACRRAHRAVRSPSPAG